MTPTDKELYKVAERVTDELLGAGTYEALNHFSPAKGEYPMIDIAEELKEFNVKEVMRLAERHYDLLKVFESELARRRIQEYHYHTSAWSDMKSEESRLSERNTSEAGNV